MSSNDKDYTMMNRIEELVAKLTQKDNIVACDSLKKLIVLAEKDLDIYSFFDTFVSMLGHSNSYIRTRGILLVSACAKWDTKMKIDKNIGQCLKMIYDPKPVTARQAIQTFSNIAKYKPTLTKQILETLKNADFNQYTDSMRPLLLKDATEAIQSIESWIKICESAKNM